jgi:hypothetical protein
MPAPCSFAKYYWAAWLVGLGVLLASSSVFPLGAGLGWFALVAGVGSAYVFHFEFGRLMGFLKVHCPSQHAELQSKHFLEVLAFAHPSLIRKLWQPPQSPPLPHELAFRVYRSAWLFSVASLAVILLLANTLQ